MSAKSMEKELLELERQYWQALKDNDAAKAIQLSDDPCIVAGAQGVSSIDRENMSKMLENPNWRIDSFTLDDKAEVRMLGNDVAVLAYKVHEDLTVDGKPVSFDAADASTWVRRNGKWVCALHTESIAGDPFGRDKQPKK